MSHTKTFDKITIRDIATAGGKGASLGDMYQAKIPVPPGFVVLADAFEYFLDKTEIGTEISSRIDRLNIKDINSVNRMSRVVMDLIKDVKIDQKFETEILEAFDKLGASRVAVRSSATAEDSQVASWAGELESYLNIDRDNVIEKVKHCWASLFTPRAIFYRFEQGLAESQVSVAVVVQEMVESERSGIAFTVHPVTKDKNQMLIEAAYGLGEAIVSGSITPDSYVIDKINLTPVDLDIGEQKSKVVYAEKGTKSVDLDPAEGKRQIMAEDEMLSIAKTCQRVEEHYGFPCDIEWAWAKGKLYITQSRPITTL